MGGGEGGLQVLHLFCTRMCEAYTCHCWGGEAYERRHEGRNWSILMVAIDRAMVKLKSGSSEECAGSLNLQMISVAFEKFKNF